MARPAADLVPRRFLGTDEDVNIQTAHPEFRAWKWADPDELRR
jgi:hypothetical protein